MQVRPAVVADATGIADVHVRSWQGAYRGLIPQPYLDGLDPAQRVPLWTRRAGGDWTTGGCLVAADETGVVGFADFGPSRDADADQEQVGEVAAIYLLPRAWGTGCGRALMTAALDHLRADGYRQVTLWVLDTNDRARRFYQAAGFAADGAERVEEIGGSQVREVRYRRPLP
jgi:ribosomal protein S18 acetylase RimI-like enzyme